ncbi:MAG: hypothetical protein AAFR54_23500, partial [Planctomycetota bacterium]
MGPAWGTALALLAVAGGVFWWERRARMQRRIQEGLMAGAPGGDGPLAASGDEDEFREPSALEHWLASAG